MDYRQISPYMMWYQGPMGNMYDPIIEEEDEPDLAMLYPELYHRVMPLVRYHGDQMEMRYGAMYCPTKDEFGKITDDIYDRIDKDMNVDEYDESDDEYRGYYRNNEEEVRQRPRRRRRFLRDLISILFLRELHRRRRRRRRRRPY